MYLQIDVEKKDCGGEFSMEKKEEDKSHKTKQKTR